MKTSIILYVFVTCLLVLDGLLFVFAGVSVSGTLAEQLLFWCWLVITFCILFLHRKSRWTKVYAGLLLFLLFVAALPMGAPLVMLHTFALGKEVSYQVGNIHVTETFKSPFARPYISVIRSYGLYEKEIAMLDRDFEIKGKIYHLDDVLSIKEIANNFRNELVFVFKTDSITRQIR